MWTVSFISLEGDALNLVGDAGGIAGTDAAVEVAVIHDGTDKEKQTITTTLLDGNAVSGSFRLRYFGSGGNEETNLIEANPAGGDCDSVAGDIEDELEALTSVGNVTVTADSSAGDAEGGCVWMVSFDTNTGNIDEMKVATEQDVDAWGGQRNTMGGSGAGKVDVVTTQDGNADPLGGIFTLTFQGQTTGYLSSAATDVEMKHALEALGTMGTVDVSRSDADANGGYEWSVTFVTELGDVGAMIVDDTALTGTSNVATVQEAAKGVAPGCNSARGLPAGSFTITDMGSLEYTIGDLEQGVSTPRFMHPYDVSPGAPTDVTLEAVDGSTLKVTFQPPILDGGNAPDEYRVEWDTAEMTAEVQTVAIDCPVTYEEQTVSTTTDSATQDNIRGTFTLSMLGHTTDPIPYNAEDSVVKSRLEALINVGTVDVSRSGPSQAGEYSWTITFTSTPGWFPHGSGNLYELDADGGELYSTEGNGVSLDATVITDVDGSDPLSGSFTLTYEDATHGQQVTGDIPYDASAAVVQAELESLVNVGHVDVERTETANGYSWEIHFSHCSADPVDASDVCMVGDLLPLSYTSQLVGGTIDVVETIKGTASPSRQSYVVTDLSSGAPYEYYITNLDENVDYYVRVSAHTSCHLTCPGCCGYGSYAASTPSYASPAHQTPGAPRAPILVASTATSMTLKWEHPTTTGGSVITGYQLWMDNWIGGSYFMIYDGTHDANTLTFDTSTKRTLDSGAKYRFKVRAVNEVGIGAFSEESVFTARAPVRPAPPLQPTRNWRTGPGSTSDDATVAIDWKRPADNGGSVILDYEIYRDDGHGSAFGAGTTAGTLPVQEIAIVSATSGTFALQWRGDASIPISYNAAASELRDAIEGLTHAGAVKVSKTDKQSWKVTFLTVHGDLEKLTIDSALLIAASANVITDTQGAGDAAVQYNGNNNNLRYVAFASGKPGMVNAMSIDASGLSCTGTLSHTARGLEDGRPYRFYVKAKNDQGTGKRSPIATVLAAGLPSASTSIDLAWATPAHMMGSAPTGYVLYMFAGVAPNTVANPNPVQFEVQTITVDADSQVAEVQDVTIDDVTGGTFSLRIRGESTSELNYNVGRNALRDELMLLAGVGSVDVSRSGGGSTFTWSITFNALDGDVPALFVDTALLQGGQGLKATVA